MNDVLISDRNLAFYVPALARSGLLLACELGPSFSQANLQSTVFNFSLSLLGALLSLRKICPSIENRRRKKFRSLVLMYKIPYPTLTTALHVVLLRSSPDLISVPEDGYRWIIRTLRLAQSNFRQQIDFRLDFKHNRIEEFARRERQKWEGR
jgi:hypothetical protein